MTTIVTSGGPWFVARRMNANASWQMNEQGFDTEAEAIAWVATQDPNYDYSWVNVQDVKPAQVNRTTRTPQ